MARPKLLAGQKVIFTGKGLKKKSKVKAGDEGVIVEVRKDEGFPSHDYVIRLYRTGNEVIVDESTLLGQKIIKRIYPKKADLKKPKQLRITPKMQKLR